MRFELPLALLLLVVPLLVLAARGWLRRRGRLTGAVTFSDASLAAPLSRSWRVRLAPLPVALRVLALALLAVAIARPQRGVSETRIATDGVAIQVVVDRSGSMNEPMLLDGRAVTRLDAVKHVFRQFLLGDEAAANAAAEIDASRNSSAALGGRANDLVGVIAFARFPETIVPLSRSHDTVARLVQNLAPASDRMESGTAVGDALLQAVVWLDQAEKTLKRKRDEEKLEDFKIKSKVVVLLTDGQDNASLVSPVQAAEKAAELGVKVYAIGVGGQSRDFFGRDEVDRALLSGIARRTGGKFWLASDGESLRQIYEEIDRLEKTRIEATEFTDYSEQFMVLAAGALALVALEALLASAILRRVP